MSPTAALIFAAGFGTRMGDLTKTCPKPLIKVSGKPLIDYGIDTLTHAGIKNIVANLHYYPDQLEQHLGKYGNITTIRETPDILETGGGLKNALPLLGTEPVITLNSDAVWTGANPIRALLDAWDSGKMDALLMLIPTQNAQEHRGTGDFTLTKLGHITRKGTAAAAPYVYSGAQIIKTDRLIEITESCFSLNLLWDKMLTDNRAYGIVHTGGWVDVGRPEGIDIAAHKLAQNADV